MATERLDIIVKLNDASKAGSRAVKQNLSGIENAATKAGSAIKGLVAGFLGIQGIFAAGRGFTNAIRTFTEFDDAMRQAGAVAQATAQEFEDLTAIAQKMGAETRFTATQAAQGLKFLGLAGFEAAESVLALPSVLQLASAGSLDLGQSADITTNILAAFGLQVEDLSNVNDQLVKTFTSSNNSLIEIGEAFKLVGPIAKGVGGDFSDLLAAIGKLGDAGLKASIGGTSLRGTLAALFNPTKAEARLMEELSNRIGGAGLQITKVNGDFIGFAEIIRQLEVAGVDGAEAMELFGLRAGPGVAALLNQGSEALFALRENIRDSEGIAEEIAVKIEAGIGGAIRQLQAATENLKIVFIDTFGEETSKLIKNLTEDIRGLTKAMEDNKPILQGFVNFITFSYDRASEAVRSFSRRVIALIKLTALLEFAISKVSFTATVRNVSKDTELIRNELKKILQDVGLLRTKIEQTTIPIQIDADFRAIAREIDKTLIDAIGEVSWDEINKEIEANFNWNIFDPEKAEVQLKAGLIKVSALLDKEAAKLKAEYANGIIDLDLYFEEREDIVRKQINKELALLKEKAEKELDLNKRELINAAIFAKEQELQQLLIELEQEKLKEFKKIEKQKNSEFDRNLRKRLVAEQKAAKATDLLNDIKIRNALSTSNELESVFKNETIKLQERQRQELENFKKNTADEIKIAEFKAQQLIEIERLVADQKRRLQEKLNKDFNDSEKILTDIKLRNSLIESQRLEDVHANELLLLKQRQAEELKSFTDLEKDKARIDELLKQQELEREKLLVQQKKALKDQELENAKQVFSGLSQLSTDLFQLSGSSSKELFAISKAAAIAEATINTYTAATKALAEGGPFLGPVLAGIIVAQGLANVAKIQSQSLAEGGIVQGHSPHSKADNISANLTAGEHVTNVAAVKDFGPGFMDLVNSRAPNEKIIAALSKRGKIGNFSIPKTSSARVRMADGGIAPSQAKQQINQAQQQQLNIVNVLDPKEFLNVLNTPQGKNTLLNIMRSDANKFNRALA